MSLKSGISRTHHEGSNDGRNDGHKEACEPLAIVGMGTWLVNLPKLVERSLKRSRVSMAGRSYRT